MGPRNLRVYLADDHTLFRKAIVNMVQGFGRVKEVKDAENGKELITLMRYDEPDVVLVDLQMPVMDGVETSEYILKRFPNVKIIMLTMHDSEKYVLHMMGMGVHGFLLKNTEPDELEKAIYSVIEKDFYKNDWLTAILRKGTEHGERPDFSKTSPELSQREKEIIRWVCLELSSREIGDKMALSERTVQNYRLQIMKKISVKNTIGLVHYAYQNGIL